MKIIFVYEHFFEPFDEGVKNFARMIHSNLADEHQVKVVRYLRLLPNGLNSLLLVPRLLLARLIYRPDQLIFIPQASLTFSSLVKIYLLEKVYGHKLTSVGTQKRELNKAQALRVKRFKLRDMFVLSSSMAEPLLDLGINSQVVNVGIDRERYSPVSQPEKMTLRKKYQLETNKRIILHVGHIKEKRNARWLMEIQQRCEGVQTVLVGSTTTVQDNSLCHELEASGVHVIKDYLADIQEIYQLADLYCFTVTQADGAMETPLSVLEAMAVDIPIITTPFGRLPEQFQADEGYQYIESADQAIALLDNGFGIPGSLKEGYNRSKTEAYTWKASADKLLAHRL